MLAVHAISGDMRNVGVVSPLLFGGIAVNQTHFDDYLNDHDLMNLRIFRFPGGAVAENGYVSSGRILIGSTAVTREMLEEQGRPRVAFDLRFPELMNPAMLAADEADGGDNRIASLSDLFAAAAERFQPVDIIIPIQRYTANFDITIPAERAEMERLVRQDLGVFLDRLTSGYYNDGVYPPRIDFSIGNEDYTHPVRYAVVARLMLDLIQEAMVDADIPWRASIQTGIGTITWDAIMADPSRMADYFDADGNPVIRDLAGWTWQDLQDLTWTERMFIADRIMISIMGERALQQIGGVRHHHLASDIEAMLNPNSLVNQRERIEGLWLDAIARAGGDPTSVARVVSAWTTDSSNFGNDQAGMPAALNTLAIFDRFVRYNVDYAAAWGIAAGRLYDPDGYPRTVLSWWGDGNELSPAAAILSLMAESIPGARMIDTGDELRMTRAANDDYLLSAYHTDRAVTVFVGVGDLGGENLTLRLSISDFGPLLWATVDRVTTISGELSGPARIDRERLTLRDGEVAVTFTEDFETARITFRLADPAGGSIENGTITGSEGIDALSGTAGDEIILALGGSDTIRDRGGNNFIDGGSGHDTIHGGAGNDTLIGGDGDDVIFDAVGLDEFYGGRGDDRITVWGGPNTIFGAEGNDLLRAGYGADTIDGGPGNDLIEGDFGALLMYGTDRLRGGGGNDFLQGGLGADRFIFAPGDGRDVIGVFDPDRTLYDPATGWRAFATEFDFRPGIDHIMLEGFETVTPDNVLSFVRQGSQGAVFSAEGTQILFFGVARAILTVDEFLFS